MILEKSKSFTPVGNRVRKPHGLGVEGPLPSNMWTNSNSDITPFPEGPVDLSSSHSSLSDSPDSGCALAIPERFH